MKKILVVITLLLLAFLLPDLLMAQVKHELKSDIRTFYAHDNVSSEIRLMYELVPKRSLGFELDINYIWDDTPLPDSLTTFPNFSTYQEFDRQYAILGVTAKLYPFHKRQEAAKFYVGIYNAYKIETYRKEGYREKFRELYQRDPEIHTLEALVFGGSVGYKLLIIKRIILELNIRMGVDILAPIRTSHFDLDGDAFIKLGYRFGKNTSPKTD